MTTRRLSYSATLLTNGKALIAGGHTQEQAGTSEPIVIKTLASAELYDPATGRFTATGNMTTPREAHTATVLPDGKVLIAGGVFRYGAEGLYVNSIAHAELYDPDTGTFAATGDMNSGGTATATFLANGKVLIADGVAYGGLAYGGLGAAGAELYDPSTGNFTATVNLISGRVETATLLANGKVLFIRGVYDGPDPVFLAELYDPSTGTFAGTGNTITNWPGKSATLLTNGKVLVANGDFGSPENGFRSTAELYDPATGTFAVTDNMTTSLQYPIATLLPDGTVLIAGSGSPAQLYDPVAGTFRAMYDGATHRVLQTATLLNDGRVLITESHEWPLPSGAELFNPAVLTPAPVLFCLSQDGRRQGAILHAGTHQVVSPNSPAIAGEVLEIYGAGLIDGGVIPPQVAIGGRTAEVLFFGKAPGYVGLNQINVRVPNGIVSGLAVSVRLNYLNRPSNEVTIVVQ